MTRSAHAGRPVHADVFAEGGAPRAVLANFGVGYNHIDVAAAARQGGIVTNTPGAVTDATADIALTLILMTAAARARASGWCARASGPAGTRRRCWAPM
jgi:lactate dehydrogenase-like 2-hydroxyacid dehydrogenase